MTKHRSRHHPAIVPATVMASVMIIASGCVSTDTHQKALDDLARAKQLSASQAEELEKLKKKSQAESD
jgi:hypothetical protein